ncbi:IS66 family insertion sequence element accessory protein TnpB, partial [Rhodomicrobium sp. Az07]|nr:IS66 family insertion sequence element accessory protein TnpB [Rhodomicrobium sp. Az07]
FGAVPPRIYIATRPVDFRKGMDGLAAAVQEVLKLDPSRRIEERRADIFAVWEARKDISLEELRQALVEIGLTV